MSIKRKDLHRVMSAQALLFDKAEITEGALDISMLFRNSLTQAIRQLNAESRYIVAARVSELVGRNISKDMLDKYTSSNPDYGLRAEDLPAFCAVVNSIEPFQVLLAPLGHEVISPEEGELVRLGRLERQKADLEQEIIRIRVKAGIGR